MKNTLKLTLFALLAFGMFGEKKLTQDDLKKAEATLFNEDQTANQDLAPEVAEKYCKFVEQNPDDPTASGWLYHALEINVFITKNADKSVEISNKLMEDYPDSEWAPMSLFLMGAYVYNDQIKDTAQAHVALQRLIDEYPESELVEDAKSFIGYLGLTPEQIMTAMMVSQMEVAGDF